MVGIVIYLTIAAKYHAHAYSANKLINEPLITAFLLPFAATEIIMEAPHKKTRKAFIFMSFYPLNMVK
jgi:hypothetical protein